MYQGEENVQTLEVVLQDVYKKLEVILYYGVFENLDVITRACKIVNKGEDKVNLLRAYSMCLDFNNKDMDFVHFYGRHAMERIMERTPLHHGIQSVGSRRGFSSHQHNPLWYYVRMMRGRPWKLLRRFFCIQRKLCGRGRGNTGRLYPYDDGNP